MTFKTLLIQLAVGESNTHLLEVSGELARRLQASVIGIAGCAAIALTYGDGFVSGEVFQDEHDELQSELLAAEAEFKEAFKDFDTVGSSISAGWHAAVVYETIARFIGEHVCEADLLITATGVRGVKSNRCADVGDLVMELGRPVFVTPRRIQQLLLDRTLIAWSDTRESRRAISDALPLLRLSSHVLLAQFVPPDEFNDGVKKLALVVHWLQTHGVRCESITLPSTGEDPTALGALIDDRKIDLVVAGAYGHSRLREWVLGGVTRDLLRHDSHCSLLSH